MRGRKRVRNRIRDSVPGTFVPPGLLKWPSLRQHDADERPGDARPAANAAMSDMVKPAHVVASLRDAKSESRRDSSTCLCSRIERATSEPHHPHSLAPAARSRG